MPPALESLRALLRYEPETGLFFWRANLGNCPAHRPAGCIRRGYRRIQVNGQRLAASRLAWLFVHGQWPARAVDHINGNTADDRIANLRLCTTQQNSWNAKLSVANRTGYKGVFKHAVSGQYYAQIRVDGISVHLGCFAYPWDAHAAYCHAALKHRGEFSNTGVRL